MLQLFTALYTSVRDVSLTYLFLGNRL